MSEENTSQVLYIKECDTLVVLPVRPQFNQWLIKSTLHQYDLPNWAYEHNMASHVLVNWSPVKDKYGFHVLRKPNDIAVVDTEAFKYLRGIMSGIKVKTNHIMIEDVNDILIFKMMFSEFLK